MNVMNKKWLRRRYRGLPLSVRRVLGNERLNGNVRALQACLIRNPDSNATRSRLADALVECGRNFEALSIWRALFRRRRNRASLHFQRATWAMRSRKHREAEKYLRLCLRVDDGYFGETAHFWRADALTQLGRYSEAVQALESVSDDYYELWFFGRPRWSKSDLLTMVEAIRRS
jgi:tetratricopeptide (TPR) repeat protein